MKTTNVHPEFNSKDFYSFAKLPNEKKVQDLILNGIHVDTTFEKELRTHLFFLRGFFVELVICNRDGSIKDILPIKQGYKFEHFFKLKELYTPSMVA